MLDKDIKLTIYRIIQEQVSNILKHSGAQNAVIQLSILPHFIRLVVSDDGKGLEETKKPGGIGLQNMKNRIEYYDGTINLHSTPGVGCSLEVTIPIKEGNELQGLN